MNFATHTSAMVFYRKEHGLSQTEVARAMATTQSAVARLEKRLLTGADVTLSALQRYAEAIGLSIELTLKPVKQRYGFFPTAEAAIAAAVHTSACEILSLHFAKDPAGIRFDHRSKAEDGLPLTDEPLLTNLTSPIVKLAKKILMDSLKVLKIEIPSRNIVVTLLRFNKLRVCDLTL